MLVCGNTAAMLQHTRYARFFDVDRRPLRRTSACSTARPTPAASGEGGASLLLTRPLCRATSYRRSPRLSAPVLRPRLLLVLGALAACNAPSPPDPPTTGTQPPEDRIPEDLLGTYDADGAACRRPGP